MPYTWEVPNKYSESLIFHPVAKVILLDINQSSLASSQAFSGFLSQLEFIAKFLPCPHDLDPGRLSYLLSCHVLIWLQESTKHARSQGGASVFALRSGP